MLKRKISDLETIAKNAFAALAVNLRPYEDAIEPHAPARARAEALYADLSAEDRAYADEQAHDAAMGCGETVAGIIEELIVDRLWDDIKEAYEESYADAYERAIGDLEKRAAIDAANG